jgi:prepilin-type N-terminal cleavage/methylation domain-containing protein
MTMPRLFRPGFTIIELLVVISIITLLISISLPHLQRSKYESRMAVCLSNQHQFGLATLNYANDHKEALPRQDEAFTTGVNTWDLSNRFPIEMGRYGVADHRMWDCPVTPMMPRTVTSWDEAKAWFSSAYGYFSITPYNWWVPRKFGTTIFPSPQAGAAADPNGWPTHVGSPVGVKQPIMSDRMGRPVGQPADPAGASDGHQWAGKVESTNILFTDAHAERRSVREILWRFTGNWQNFY